MSLRGRSNSSATVSRAPNEAWVVVHMVTLPSVLMLADGHLRADDFTAQRLAGYRVAVVPDCPVLTPGQVEALLAYVESSGRLLVYGRLAENVATPARAALLSHPNTALVTAGEGDPKHEGAPSDPPGAPVPTLVCASAPAGSGFHPVRQ